MSFRLSITGPPLILSKKTVIFELVYMHAIEQYGSWAMATRRLLRTMSCLMDVTGQAETRSHIYTKWSSDGHTRYLSLTCLHAMERWVSDFAGHPPREILYFRPATPRERTCATYTTPSLIKTTMLFMNPRISSNNMHG